MIDAEHNLHDVELTFRMDTSDLRAQPVFDRDAIEVRRTSCSPRWPLPATDTTPRARSIEKLVRALRTARSATITISTERITLAPDLTDVTDTDTELIHLDTGHSDKWNDPGRAQPARSR
ncbi:MAG: hypothetical protein ACYCTH_13175 [Cellulomonas sp.]